MAKYERIADDLRTLIKDGTLTPGEQLAAETTLTERYRVSLPTLRQALGVLRAEGLIESRQGIGTYVRAPQHRVRRSPERYHAEKQRARLPVEARLGKGAVEDDTGLNYEDVEFNAEFDVEPASNDLAAVFGIDPGTSLLCRTYCARYRNESRPLHLIHSYLVYDMAAKNPDLLSADSEPWPGGTMNQLHTIGVELSQITEYVTARPPTSTENELLEIDKGVSVLCIRKVSEDLHNNVVEVSDIFLPGDRTELVYTTKLEEW